MMYLTEFDAKQKMCPHMTYDWVEHDNNDNKITRQGQAMCLASSCMAWRWAGGLPSTEKGYCGLSGRPGPSFEKEATDGQD